MYYHKPVMLTDVVESLCVRKDQRYLDCNFGQGGHSREILDRGGYVLGIDVDCESIKKSAKNFESYLDSEKLKLVCRNFSNLYSILEEVDWLEEEISGILYDLGLSLEQIKLSGKGFSFENDEVLDMRIDKNLKVRAIDLLRVLNVKQLCHIFEEYSNEPNSFYYAKVIKRAVSKNPDLSALELGELMKRNSKSYKGKYHPATRVFQALRIAVNCEFDNLEKSLLEASEILGHSGRLVIITFHRLEEQVVKDTLKDKLDLLNILSPTLEEVYENPSSRSAKLYVYEKKKE